MWKWIQNILNIFNPSDPYATFLDRYILKRVETQLIVLSVPEQDLDDKTKAHYVRLGLKKITKPDIVRTFVIIDEKNRVFKNYWHKN